jgi:hypothetical protein
LAKPSDVRARPVPRDPRRPGAVAVALLVALLHVSFAPAEPVDTLLAQVDARTISASDIALARALAVFGFAPSSSPITRTEVDRFVDVLLILSEAAKIGVTAEPGAVDTAWAPVATRAGGEEALTRWLEDKAIDRDWARLMVGEDIVKSKFLDARFAAFIFPDEEAVTRELGPGQHDDDARERVREKLIRRAAVEAQAKWLDDARRRASIKILLPAEGSVVPPFTGP